VPLANSSLPRSPFRTFWLVCLNSERNFSIHCAESIVKFISFLVPPFIY
jgi:hypothetical protein